MRQFGCQTHIWPYCDLSGFFVCIESLLSFILQSYNFFCYNSTSSIFYLIFVYICSISDIVDIVDISDIVDTVGNNDIVGISEIVEITDIVDISDIGYLIISSYVS